MRSANSSATLLALTVLLAGCSETPATTEGDGGPFVPSYDPDGESCELPPACGEPLQPSERPADLPVPGATLRVESVVPEGEGFRVSFVAASNPSVLLPAEPLLEVGDEVSFEEQRGALVLSVDGEWVALLSNGPLGDGEEERAIHQAMEDAHESGAALDLELLGVPLTLEVGCGGWQGHVGWNNGCSDVPTVAFAIRTDGGSIPLGGTGTLTATDGRAVVVENRGIMVDIAGGEGCLRCLDSITATCGRCGSYQAHGFRVRMVRQGRGDGRTCSGLPAACAGDGFFDHANPTAFGTLTEGEWTVSQTVVADERVQLELERDGESVTVDLPADPLFEDDEAVTISRDAHGITIETADGESAVYFGPNQLPGDTIEIAGFTFGTVVSCGGWVPHQTSPDLCPLEAAEALSLTLEGTTIAPAGEVSGIGNARTEYTIENRGVFRTVENAEPGDECAGCLDPQWGRSAVLVVRTPR